MKNNLPFNVMRDRNSWDNAPRDPITIGNFIFASLGISTTSLAVLYITGFVATTLVVSAITRALMPKPPSMQEGLLTNVRQPAAPWDIIYGETRKGGTITHIESTGDKNKYLHMIITLAGHEVAELGDIYVNDSVVTVDENHYVTSEPWVKGSNTDYIYIRKFTGASNQNIYSTLSGITDGPTFLNEAESNTPSNFKGRGVASLYVRLKYDREVFASGIPNITCVVKGKKVYDPRTGVTAYSDNAALCIRDYLISEYGLNTPESTIDDTYFSTAATDCDTNSGSGADNKFRIGGVVSTDKNLRTNLQDMVGSCVGSLYYSAGKFKLIVGVYSPPVKSLGLDDLRSEISLNTKSSRRDNFNSVQGTFIWSGVDDGSGNAGDWTQTDYPPITSPTFVTEDNEYENPLQLDLPLTTQSATAQRIAKQTLFRAREQMQLSAEFGMNAFDLEVGDTVSLTIDRYGFDSKEFEVISWGFSANQDAGDLRVTLGLKETSAAAYSWDGEEEDIISNNSNLPSPNVGLTITNLTASAGGRTQGDGTFINSAILNWDDVTNAYLDYYDIEWKTVSDTAYSATTSNLSIIELSPLIDGIQYTFRVRAVNMSGFRGEWSEVLLTGGGDTTAPSVPTSVSATGGFRYITISWTNPPETDLNYVEVWENTTNNVGSAAKVGQASASEFVRSNLGISETKWYFVRAVDFSGNTSDFSAGVSATTTFVDDDDFANGIYSLFTEQGLYAIRDVTSLPASGAFVGEKVFNRADGKLYQWTGAVWEQVVGGAEDFSDLEGSIAGAQIPDGLIDTLKLADDAVSAAKLANSAVTTDILAASAVTETKISNNAITTPKIAAGAVTASEIAAGSITSSEIAANTIAAGNIAAGAITADEIAANAITSAKITAGAIIGDKIAASTITGDKIGANQITGNNISGQTITGDKVVANTITGGLLAASGIITNSAQITDAVVTNAKIDNLAVTTIKVADRAITSQTSTSVASFNSGSAVYTTAASVSFSTPSAGEEVIVGGSYIIRSLEPDKTASYRLYFNGVMVAYGSTGGNGQPTKFTDVQSRTTVAGTNTLYLSVGGASGGTGTTGLSLFTMEALK